AVAEAVETMIRALGFETSSARSAAEALKADLTGHDLVFSDVLMPGGMDGVELALRLRELHPGLPILLTSGYAGAPERVSRAGFPLLSKPYTEEAWLAAVQRLLKVGVGP
ncbi:response regulator, partial [uncultured Aquincola sp.]|uniref:response regulator n=1 Tax=uncultured Aquincola sp. TaxID=886556 RepID=UPI0032B28777